MTPRCKFRPSHRWRLSFIYTHRAERRHERGSKVFIIIKEHYSDRLRVLLLAKRTACGNTPGGLHHYEITHLHYANHTTLVYAHTVSVITRTSFPYFYKRVHSYSAPATRQHILNALVRNPRDRAGGPEHRDARAKAPPEAAKATLCGHGA